MAESVFRNANNHLLSKYKHNKMSFKFTVTVCITFKSHFLNTNTCNKYMLRQTYNFNELIKAYAYVNLKY